MELVFLTLLIVSMATALGSGFPVAFALPGSAILTIGAAALAGQLIAGDSSAYFAQGGPIEWLTAGVTNFRGIYWEVERDTLIAIPLFVFMGIMLQRSRIAEDLLITMARLFGPIPGGLGISVVFVGALLAATTGIVGATVVAMGLISLPTMMHHNYSNRLSAGTIAASGTLGQIIPPSIVLIILADQLAGAADQASAARKALYRASTGDFAMPPEFDTVSTSAGDMFMGALVPGLVLVGAYMLFLLALALLRPGLAPPVPFEGRYDARFALGVLFILVPPLTLIVVVLGSIITGIATVNQAGAIGAAGALIMAGTRLWEGRPGAFHPAVLAALSVAAMVGITIVSPINVKRIETGADFLALTLVSIAVAGFVVSLAWSGWRAFTVESTLQSVMGETAKTSSLVFIILLGAAMLTAAFRAIGGEDLVREFLTSLPGGFWTQFVTVMAVIFVLGFFLDFIEIAVVVVPIVAPILLMDPSANVTAVWLGVMIGLNIQTSFLTPPFGFALFYLRGVAPPAVRTLDIYRGVIAFIVLQLLVLAIVAVSPRLVNYLPSYISLTSETAPPPINPRLQSCLEEHLFEQYDGRGETLRRAIARARGIDLSHLPEMFRESTSEAIDKAGATFRLVQNVDKADAAIEAVEDAYRPLHAQVRGIERDVRRIDSELERLKRSLNLLGANDDRKNRERRQDIKAEIMNLDAERDYLLSEIPDQWKAAHAGFEKLQEVEEKARRAYRHNVDGAYKPIRELVGVIEDTDRLAALGEELEAMRKRVATSPPDKNVEPLTDLARSLGDIEGTGDVRSRVTEAQRELRGKEPDRPAALDALDEAIRSHRDDVAWRRRAESELLPELAAYEAAIRDTIGLRQQPRVPDHVALELAYCTAAHRDISLHF